MNKTVKTVIGWVVTIIAAIIGGYQLGSTQHITIYAGGVEKTIVMGEVEEVYSQLEEKYDILQNQYIQLDKDYINLQSQYVENDNNYKNLKSQYNELESENRRLLLDKDSTEATSSKTITTNYNWFTECEPYEVANGRKYNGKDDRSFVMSGEEHREGLTISPLNGKAIFNLGGKFSTFEIYIGHVDGGVLKDMYLTINIDGNFYDKLTIPSSQVAQKYTISLDYAETLELIPSRNDSIGGMDMGFAKGNFYE